MSFNTIKVQQDQLHSPKRSPYLKVLIGGGLATMLSGTLLQILNPIQGFGAIVPPIIGIAAAVFGSGMSPFGSWLLGFRKKQIFDEFEREALNRATRLAFGCFVWLATLLCFWCSFGLKYDWAIPSTNVHWLFLATTFLVFNIGLPVFIAELIIPAPPKDEEADDA